MAKRYHEGDDILPKCMKDGCEKPVHVMSGIHGLCEDCYRDWCKGWFVGQSGSRESQAHIEIDPAESNPHFGIKCLKCNLLFKSGGKKAAQKDGWIVSSHGAFCPGCPADGES